MYFDPDAGLVLLTLTDDEGATLHRIETECGIVVSPVSAAEVIVYGDDGSRVLYKAVHGRLPDATIVVAVLNGHGAFPDTEEKLKAKVLLDPYQVAGTVDVVELSLAFIAEGCPICGQFSPDEDEDSDAEDDEDEDEDEDDPDDDAPYEIPMPRRFTFLDN